MPIEFEQDWYNENDIEHPDIRDQIVDAFRSHAIISGFSWTAGMAHYLGYWQDEDLEHPICAQLINSG